MPSIKAYCAESETAEIAPLSIDRREPRPDNVAIRIDYCGICHTDISDHRQRTLRAPDARTAGRGRQHGRVGHMGVKLA